jgi:hypothetical protein
VKSCVNYPTLLFDKYCNYEPWWVENSIEHFKLVPSAPKILLRKKLGNQAIIIKLKPSMT